MKNDKNSKFLSYVCTEMYLVPGRSRKKIPLEGQS